MSQETNGPDAAVEAVESDLPIDTDIDADIDIDIDADIDAHFDADADTGSPLTANWQRPAAFVVVPALAVALGGAAGFLGWQYYSAHGAAAAAGESVAAARDTTVAILSYRADTVEADLNAAKSRLTGSFLNAYTELVNDVVIPGAKEKNISAAAQVPAAASVSATATSAVALLFVNQSVSIGEDPPTSTSSSVRVTLDKVGDRWLVSGFDPV